ncbi:MAG: hypothetical protein K0S47_2197 [Herbinix sp.]|jgi:hypothetical protein|nr:hypothetical protein [Herbinix sp.]
MRNKKIIEALDKIEPSDATQERLLKNIIKQSSRKRKSHRWRQLGTVVAAVVVILTGAFVYDSIYLPNQLSIPQEEDDNQLSSQLDPTTIDLTDMSKEIRGLPVNNFKLSEIEQLYAADRIVFLDFIDFFKYEVDSYAIIKVGDAQVLPSTEYSSDTQIATVKVLETVWGDELPDTTTITQYLYGGCTGDEVTNLMREGGVYLLPLIVDKDNFYIMGDLDVLFEIDKEGHIWSHSDFENFNRFDGGDYKSVTDEIKRITQDETMMLASSRFGMAMRGFQLAEVTILSEGKDEENEYGYSEVAYTAKVERTLSGNDLSDEVTIHSYSDENITLNKGSRYLLFIDKYEEKHYINSRMIASVGMDGTVQNLGDERGPFAAYDGFTIDEMKGLADKVTEYLKVNQE